MERSAIHLLHKRGKSQRAIARELGYSRVTVARALMEPVDRRPATRRRRSKTDPFRPQIEQWVREGLTAARMLELARTQPEQPYTGGHSVFRALVRRVRLEQQHQQTVAAVPVRFEGLPGEYLQVDWGEVRRFPFLGQPRATRYFLACRLKYSRWSWVRFTPDMRQETLLRGLVDCFVTLGWVPWVLVFDNMKTVTSGRDAQGQPLWTPALLQLAHEFGFHPEACWPGAANQKGSVESLVKWVKGNFLSGREFWDDADLGQQQAAWQEQVNARPSQATDEPPNARLPHEAAQGGPLPAHAANYGFLLPGRVGAEALVAVLGNQYSVPVAHVGAPVTVRVHRTRIALWRDTLLLAEHERAPDGAHRRVVLPDHFAPLFSVKPRAQVMLYREALLQLGEGAARYISELSYRQRAALRREILAVYALLEQHGASALLAAMAAAEQVNAYGAAYLHTLLQPRATPVTLPPLTLPTLALPGVPPQAEIDRALSLYETYVQGASPPPPAGADGEAVPLAVWEAAAAVGVRA
jgi:transposase